MAAEEQDLAGVPGPGQKVQGQPPSERSLGMALPAAPGASDTLYLCNFRVSVDGDWLCLKELEDPPPLPGMIRPRPKELHTRTSRKVSRTPMEPERSGILTALYSDQEPTTVERSNLVNILRLVVREVIDSSHQFCRQLDSDNIPLQHFFIVLEHVLRHGLRLKKGILGPKKELWDFLQSAEKLDPKAADITASVRDLPTVSTHIGRARAWLRLALMQKKLPDYFKLLADQDDDILAEFYDSGALLRSEEESILITGLLLSLNVVDCNLCLKEEDLDKPQGVIDFSLYLKRDGLARPKAAPGVLEASVEGNGDASSSAQRINTALDQKNYIEELNRHLSATVSNLQAKIESLNMTNALMREDLSRCQRSLTKSRQENRVLVGRLGRLLPDGRHRRQNKPEAASSTGGHDEPDSSVSTSETGSGCSPSSSRSTEGNNEDDGDDDEESRSPLRQRLKDELKRNEDLDKELKLQVDTKVEMGKAMEQLEENLNKKENKIADLTHQLDEVKKINFEMYAKLQECEEEIREKGELVSRLEAKTQEIGRMLSRLNQA